jgi:hypothetical protein
LFWLHAAHVNEEICKQTVMRQQFSHTHSHAAVSTLLQVELMNASSSIIIITTTAAEATD